MTADARLFITEFPKIIWQLFTQVLIPGLNFSPAVFFFGILTFGVALKFIFSILHITSWFGKPGDGLDQSHRRAYSGILTYDDLRD